MASMPTTCIMCHKKVEDPENICYAVYKCRAETPHLFVVCKVECQRALEKKTDKVAEGLRKIMHKLNNDGHTSALRRLPPGEREKLKQHSEAESNGLMICPEEVKACDRSVPHCSHVLDRCGGFASADQKGQQEVKVIGSPSAPPPPPPTLPLEAVDLLDDDMLEEIKRSDHDKDEETPGGGASGKAKQSKKGAKQSKKGQVLLLDFKTPTVAPEEERTPEPAWSKPSPAVKGSASPGYMASTSPVARSPGGLGAAQAWSAVASRQNEASASPIGAPVQQAQIQRPADYQQKVKTLTSTTGCSETRALELLALHNWNLDSSADTFFNQDNGDKPRWGPRVGQASPKPAQGHGKAGQSQSEGDGSVGDPGVDGADEDAQAQPPAPSQPPPPRLPPNWQALWSEEQQAYYFWHVPTNHTTWMAPPLEEGAEVDREQEAERSRQEELVTQASQITGADPEIVRPLLESQGWSLENAVRVHVQQEDERRVQESARQRQVEESQRVAEVARQEEQARKDASQAAEEDKRRQAEGSSAQPFGEGHYVCSRHWRPRPGVDVCIRLFHGERVMVTWVDGKEHGWAYGHVVDDVAKEGYFPQDLLAEVVRQPQNHQADKVCGVLERFEAPEEVAGYLSIDRGDVLKVLHPIDAPYVWAYVERVSGPDRILVQQERGWVPEAILCGVAEAEGFHEHAVRAG